MRVIGYDTIRYEAEPGERAGLDTKTREKTRQTRRDKRIEERAVEGRRGARGRRGP